MKNLNERVNNFLRNRNPIKFISKHMSKTKEALYWKEQREREEEDQESEQPNPQKV